MVDFNYSSLNVVSLLDFWTINSWDPGENGGGKALVQKKHIIYIYIFVSR